MHLLVVKTDTSRDLFYEGYPTFDQARDAVNGWLRNRQPGDVINVLEINSDGEIDAEYSF